MAIVWVQPAVPAFTLTASAVAMLGIATSLTWLWFVATSVTLLVGGTVT